ncbi:aldo/keto reductase [Anaerotalea alkaliphila]|uniref:Aldo/keto reductase n=1 Tax=Anaerotalea alkaliphila TaxID=2662126 RepID=A0A7X5HVL8_9FIRM|nr:aldo/keto reductase [Anaerotalea alkaliphila]NDL67470.1 aldo/keto reductase [Anaerotalea alkaliphila]
MEKRKLGNTGLETTVLGFGGFHLCEVPYPVAAELLNAYLDGGGNYIETAPSYGDGESEIKIGRAVAHRRNEYVLATKAHDRDYAGCKARLEQSLQNLRTDRIDLLLMHAVDSNETLEKILSPDGALRAAEEAKIQGKIGHIGISMHGQPDVLVEALKRYDFEAVMTTINYFDHCNFPSILGELVPLARKKGAAVILMKALGDGYLHRSPEAAFRFALSQPVSVVVAGINTREMLEMDLELVGTHRPMTEEEVEGLLRTAPELGNYVCRQCGACAGCPQGIDIPGIFLLEGIFDRQMGDGDVADAGNYALKERLKHWFGTKERAEREYAALDIDAKACTGCGECMPKCPYAVDIIAKLRNVDYKLDREYGKIYE